MTSLIPRLVRLRHKSKAGPNNRNGSIHMLRSKLSIGKVDCQARCAWVVGKWTA